ncbi:hypothetical protein ACEQ8H_002294 [Pleosporales sp. CAS-2024a]
MKVPIAGRSVHLRIVPRPANLSESREIFRVLRRFGELTMYKSLKFEYHNPADNIVLAIFRDDKAAQKALDASPIRFALEKTLDWPDQDHRHHGHHEGEGEGEPDDHLDMTTSSPAPTTTTAAPTAAAAAASGGIDDILRPSMLSTRTAPTAPPPARPRAQPSMPFEPRPRPRHGPEPQTRTKWFQVTVDRSRAVHQDYVERQPFWKYFEPMKSMAQEHLAKQVPHIGLSDVSKRPPNAHRTPNHVLKTMNDYVQERMPSLRGMVEGNDSEMSYRARKGL